MSQNSEGAKKAYQNRIKNDPEKALEFHKAGGRKSKVGNFGSKEKDQYGMTGKDRARMASIENHRERNHKIHVYEDL